MRLGVAPVLQAVAAIEHAVTQPQPHRLRSPTAVDPQRPGRAARRRWLAAHDEVDVPAAGRLVAVASEDGAGIVDS